MYNFNRNIRHAFPLVASILLQMYIFLNGFIFYSMLMYPGDYFDDYAKAILSYAYQLFQVGTYEIFNEIKNAGQVAYWLYVVLYFYVNFVGNSLIPGLFCALIQKKVVEKDITSYVAGLVKEAVCPSCSSAAISSHE